MIHLCDFSLKYLPIYKETIRRFGNPLLRIGIDSHTLLPNRGLYYEGTPTDLTEFWKLFDDVRAELGILED